MTPFLLQSIMFFANFSSTWKYFYDNTIFFLGDPCAQNPCVNGGQCNPNGIGGFTCTCVGLFTGPRCEERAYFFIGLVFLISISTNEDFLGLDPCANQPCRNGATCQPVNGNGYQCLCLPAYSGFDCSIRKWITKSPSLYSSDWDAYVCMCSMQVTLVLIIPAWMELHASETVWAVSLVNVPQDF